MKDLDFAYRQITVRNGKGEQDRVTVLPEKLASSLRVQLESAKALHEQDLSERFGEVELPYALKRKFESGYDIRTL